MKKYAKKATALAMAAAMAVMATPVHASAVNNAQQSTNVSDITDATEVTGENTIVAPVYKVTLPTSMPFAVDAFQLLSTDALASKDFAIVNRSNLPVSVKATFAVTAIADVTLLDSANDTLTVTTMKTISTAANAVLPEFNAAGFKITGDVSAYPKLSDGTPAPWQPGDVSIAATFEITGQRTTDYYGMENGSSGEVIGSDATRTYTELTAGTVPTIGTATVATAPTVSTGANATLTINKTAVAKDGLQFAKLFSTTADATPPTDAEDAGLTYRMSIADGVNGWIAAPKSTDAAAKVVPILDATGAPVTTTAAEKFYVMTVEVNAKGQVVSYLLTTITLS